MIRKIIIVFCFLALQGCWEIEKGEKSGQIIDIQQSGVFVKTWECKLIRGGLDDGSGVFGQSVWLTIENPEVLKKARKLMIERKNTIISYHKEFNSFCRSDSHSVFMDDIYEGNTKNDEQGVK